MVAANRITGKLLFLTTLLLRVNAQFGDILFAYTVRDYADFPWENIITGTDKYFTNT